MSWSAKWTWKPDTPGQSGRVWRVYLSRRGQRGRGECALPTRAKKRARLRTIAVSRGCIFWSGSSCAARRATAGAPRPDLLRRARRGGGLGGQRLLNRRADLRVFRLGAAAEAGHHAARRTRWRRNEAQHCTTRRCCASVISGNKGRATTLAHAASVPGVSPTDLQNLVIEIEKRRRQDPASARATEPR